MVYIVMAPSRRLDLSHNNIGAVGARALASSLADFSNLRRLSLAHSRLGDAGVAERCLFFPREEVRRAGRRRGTGPFVPSVVFRRVLVPIFGNLSGHADGERRGLDRIGG